MNTNAEIALKEYRRKLATGEVEIVRKNPAERLQENPTSLRFAINAMCYDCGGSDSDSNWRARIKYCQILKCPLHKVRLYRKGVTDDECVTWTDPNA